MSTITISIGQNYCDETPNGPETRPMYPRTWRGYKNAIVAVLDKVGATVHVNGAEAMNSCWQGHPEVSATWVADVEDGFGFLGFVEHQLGLIASAYQQDAIALTIGQTTLVGPNTIGA